MKLPILLSLLILLSGCASSIKTAAYTGTALALSEKPEWRPHFQKAYDDLGILENATTIGLPEVLAILNRLPVKELKSDKAVIIITATVLMVSEAGAPEVDVITTEKLRPTIKKMREGMKLALENNFSDYNVDGTVKRVASYGGNTVLN